MGKDGVRVDPKKSAAMQEWFHAKNLKTLNGFWGLTAYYCKIVAPFDSPTKEKFFQHPCLNHA